MAMVTLSVLLDEVGHDLLLLVIQPTGQGRNEKPNRSQVNHGESLLQDRATTGKVRSAQLWDITRQADKETAPDRRSAHVYLPSIFRSVAAIIILPSFSVTSPVS
jgi:hypothetical protein